MKHILKLLFILNFFNFHAHASIENLLKEQEIQDHLNHVYKYDLCAALIFQDEAPYLKEWIEYHHLLGVQHFYLYNNLSTDHYAEILEPYIKNRLVTLIEWPLESDNVPSWNAAQCLAYTNAIQRAVVDKVKWLAIIDSDEFLVPIHHDSLQTFLANYENDTIAAVRVYWVMFGTSHVEKIPDSQTLIETLIHNEGYIPAMWKSIVRPSRVDPYTMGGCHTQFYLPFYSDLTLPLDLIQCNHYWTRDEDYLYNIKIPRRIKWGVEAEICERWNDNFNRMTTPACDPILRFVPKLRKRMGLVK